MIARVLLLCLVLPLASCDSREPARLELPVRVSTAPLPPTLTSEGWTVTVTRARLVVSELEFTQLGEGHVRRPRWHGLLIPTAHAHPGHDAGGTVTGSLPGTHVIPYPGGPEILGTATILEGRYRGFNFTFGIGDPALLPEGDPLGGRSALLEGTARRGPETVPFEAHVELPDSTRMVGGVFEATLGPDQTGGLTIAFLTSDPIERVSLFDGVDFASVPRDLEGVARILPGTPLHNLLRRRVQDHAFHRIEWSPDP